MPFVENISPIFISASNDNYKVYENCCLREIKDKYKEIKELYLLY